MNGEDSFDFNSTSDSDIFTRPTVATSASTGQLDSGLIALFALIGLFLTLVVGTLVFLFGNGVLRNKCCKRTSTQSQDQTQIPGYSAVRMDSDPDPDPAPAPQAASSHSAQGPIIDNILIRGENCPVIGKSENDEFKFETVKSAEQTEPTSPEPDSSTCTQEPEAQEHVSPPDVEQGSSSGSRVALSSEVDGAVGGSGLRIHQLTIDGSNIPLIAESKGSKFNFTSIKK